MRILGIDPGEKRIGIAISDPSAKIARPLTVIKHKSRIENAERIISLANSNHVELIIIGQSLDIEGNPTFSGRQAVRLGGAIKNRTNIHVKFWDERGSTRKAKEAHLQMGVKKEKRKGHLDEYAATIILQSYLDYRNQIP